MIREFIIKKLLDAAFDRAKKLLNESGRRIVSTRDDIERSIEYHLNDVESWSSEVSFSDLQGARHISDIYVDLNLYLQPRRQHLQASEAAKSIAFKDILDAVKYHLILLGQPGAGKTTSMKQLCHLVLHDPDFQAERFTFPILIRFRDLNKVKKLEQKGLLINELLNILGLKTDLPVASRQHKAAESDYATREKLVTTLLNDLQVLLILDGFDELAPATHRLVAVEEIRHFARQLTNSTMIVTSRTGEFVYSIDKAMPFEFCSLRKSQVSSFALKWLGTKQRATEFTKKIYLSPFADTAMRPLTLAHLCAIYERIGKIPEKPKTIYRKVISLLLEEWDQQRSVVRDSRYAHFEVDRKLDFLYQMAYVLTTEYRSTIFSKDDLLAVYHEIYQDYGLLKSEAAQVVAELESHTGLILQSGYEKYEFAHKSLQEYLTAEYIVRLHNIPNDVSTLATLPNELAIAITISSKPSEYLSALVLNRLLKHPLPETFYKIFLERLLLEKPDFNTSERVAISLLALYSKYVEYMLDSLSSAGFDRFFDDLAERFEKAFELVLQRGSLYILFSYYQKEIEYVMQNSQVIFCMRRNSIKPSGEVAGIINSLPSSLYMTKKVFSDQAPKSST